MLRKETGSGIDEAGADMPHWFAGCGMLLSIWLHAPT
jgi:hypothetical protein